MTQSFLFYTTEPTLCTASPGVYQANQVFGCSVDTINIKNSCHITHGIKLFSSLQPTSPQPILQGLLPSHPRPQCCHLLISLPCLHLWKQTQLSRKGLMQWFPTYSHTSVCVFSQCSQQSKSVWSSRVAEQAAQQSPWADAQTSSTSTAKAMLPFCQVTAHMESTSRVWPAAWEAPGHRDEADWEHLSWPPILWFWPR